MKSFNFRPERIVVGNALAFLLVGLVLLTTFVVNKSITKAYRDIEQMSILSDAQIERGHEILSLATRVVAGHTDDEVVLRKVIDQFDAVQQTIQQTAVSYPARQTANIANALDQHDKTAHFLQLAKSLISSDIDQRNALLAALTAFAQDDAGLFASIDESNLLLVDEAREQIARRSREQNAALLISLLALLAIAGFLLCPSIISVNQLVDELAKKSEVLSISHQEVDGLQAQLHHLENYDLLTGLPNRTHMLTYLKTRLNQPGAAEVNLVLLGLDGFKAINDMIGHATADKLLQVLGGVFKTCVDDNDLVARVGSDEFILISDEPADELAQRVMASLNEPISINGRAVQVSASVGYLSAHMGNYDANEMFLNAGMALQTAKSKGRSRAIEFSQCLREQLTTARLLQSELREAIHSGQIEAWFQPQISLADGSVHGAEVLARWRHPTRGLLTPDKFFPVAEQAGLTVELDHEIWNNAINCATEWQSRDLWRPYISLNAAPETISDPYLLERLLKRMQHSPLGLDQICIELLETTVIDGKDDITALNIDSLAECGIALELDDFGTGYASLSRLTQLALSGIKLDRSLIAPLPDPDATSVVRAMLSLAKELGLRVIAEGIEEQQQADYLGGDNCAVGQGYLFARPMPSADFTVWLETRKNNQGLGHHAKIGLTLGA